MISVDNDQIKNLDKTQLTILCKKLLRAEAMKFGIRQGSAQGSLNIIASDGGKDVSIKWDKEICEYTDFIPSNNVLYQCKATSMPPSKCKGEILNREGDKVVEEVDELFKSGGTYVLFCSHDHRISQQKQAFYNDLDTVNANYDTEPKIEIMNASEISDWVNNYPSAISYVLQCNQLIYPVGLKNYHQLDQVIYNTPEFVTNSKIDQIIEQIHQAINTPKNVLRLIGLSGLGKTRIALEALNHGADENILEQLRSVTCYLRHEKSGEHQLINFFEQCIMNKLAGFIIVDECPLNVHRKIKNIVKSPDSNLSVLTIDYELEDMSEEEVLKLDPDDLTDIVHQILKNMFKDRLRDFEINRIAQFAEGFPQIAVLVAESRIADNENVGKLNKKEIAEKLIYGREIPDKNKYEILRACSVFEYVGFFEAKVDQAKYVSENVCNNQISYDLFYQECRNFEKRGIIEKRGDYIRVRPFPLAIRLAADWWEVTNPEKITKLITEAAGNNLGDALCKQLSKLHFVEKAKKIVSDLCEDDAPFGKAEVLTSKEGSRLFRELVKVNPEATSNSLYKNLIGLELSEYEEIKGDVRRNLVWALSDLIFYDESFFESAEILMNLAVAENEPYSNNAKGVFKQIFKVALSGTKIPPLRRLKLIDNALAKDSEPYSQLAIHSLGAALQTRNFTGQVRSVGGIVDRTSQEWYPDTKEKIEETFEYWEMCLEMFSEIAKQDPELIEIVKSEVSSHIRSLFNVNKRIVDKLFSTLKKLNRLSEEIWIDAYQAILNIKRYDLEKLSEDELDQIDEIIHLIEPNEVNKKIKFYVSTPVFDHEKEEKGKYIDLTFERVKKLAKDLINNKYDLVAILPHVLEGEQRYGFQFGYEVGELTDFDLGFIDKCIKNLATATNPNPFFLAGYVSAKNFKEREYSINAFADNENTRDLLVFFTSALHECSIELLELMISHVKKFDIDTKDLHRFSYGRKLESLKVEDLQWFINSVASIGEKESSVALRILYMQIFNDEEKFNSLKDYVIDFFLTYNPKPSENRIEGADGHTWSELIIKLLKRKESKEFPVYVYDSVVELCSDKDFLSVDHYLAKLFKVLLREYHELIWPKLSEYLLSVEGIEYLNIREVIGIDAVGFGSGKGFENERSILEEEIPKEKLIDWCNENPDTAPPFLASIIPIYKKEEKNIKLSDWVTYLIDNFGSNKEVLAEIGSNLNSFSWAGSVVSYYKIQKNVLKSLTNHKIAEVRKWSSDRIKWLNKVISQESKRDEERELGIY